ncbi:MAG: DUF4416 family protein [Candidatus Omnitrophica bacterium]|nr:DUF4416 family protein [Candidatus Omnitrophota bacterium]
MSKKNPPEPVKLFVGYITNNTALIDRTNGILEKRFGPIDSQSSIFNFDITPYYNKELGDNLKRTFFSFKRLIGLENAYKIKILTNRIEAKFSTQDKRAINIDPGYVSLSKLALFTTKDFYHRIYLGKGIYTELALFYRDKTFQPFEWSYPDYRSGEYIEFFNKLRENYMTELRRPRC